MERGIVHSICSFSFLIFLLCLIEVSSAPAQQQEMSILKTMRQDENLSCKVENLPWTFAKVCENITYPTTNGIKLSLSSKDTFLCLEVYDMFYKICNYSNHNVIQSTPMSNILSNISALPVSTNGYSSDMEITLCEKLKGLTPAYNKTKTSISLFMTDFNIDACVPICFDITHTLNQLCGLLAWFTDAEQHIKQNIKLPKSNDSVLIKANMVSGDNHSTMNEAPHIKDLPVEQPVQREKQQQPPPVQEATDKVTITSEEPKEVASSSNQKKLATGKSVTVAGSLSNHVVTESKPANIPNKDRVPQVVINNSGTNTDETVKPPPSKPEIAYTTISENTQEHEVDNNLEEKNHSAEDPMGSDDMSEPTADIAIQSQNRLEPSEQREPLPHYHSIRNEEDSHFFTYFTIISLVCIAGYVGYHNKQKVLAIVLEGRRSRSSRNRRRPSTASYRKLDCTLEEAVTSQCNANVTHVIY